MESHEEWGRGGLRSGSHSFGSLIAAALSPSPFFPRVPESRNYHYYFFHKQHSPEGEPPRLRSWAPPARGPCLGGIQSLTLCSPNPTPTPPPGFLCSPSSFCPILGLLAALGAGSKGGQCEFPDPPSGVTLSGSGVGPGRLHFFMLPMDLV